MMGLRIPVPSYSESMHSEICIICFQVKTEAERKQMEQDRMVSYALDARGFSNENLYQMSFRLGITTSRFGYLQA